MVSEDDQGFGMARLQQGSKSYHIPVEWIEEGCAQEVPLQFDRSRVFGRKSGKYFKIISKFPNYNVLSIILNYKKNAF